MTRQGGRPVHSYADVVREALARSGSSSADPRALLWSGQPRAAIDRARAELPITADPARRAELRWVLASAQLTVSDVDASLPTIERGRAEAPPAPWADRLAGLEALGRTLAGDLDGVLRVVAELDGWADLDGLARVQLLHVKAIFDYLTRDLDSLHARLDEAERIPAYDDDPGQQLLAALLRISAAETIDDGVLRLLERCEGVARRLRGAWLSWWQMVEALVHYNAGDWDAAVAATEAAVAGPVDPMHRPLHALAAVVAVHRGDPESARAHVRAQGDVPPAAGLSRFYDAIPVLSAALVAELDGRVDEAVVLVRQIVEGGVGVHSRSHVAGLGARLVRIAATAGELDLAERITAELEAGGPASHATALLARALVDDDLSLLVEARDALLARGSLLEAAWADEELARRLAESGRHQDARSAFGPAGERFRALTAIGELGRAEAAMRRHGVRFGVRGPRSRPASGWESLTETELRVAAQVSRGQTNPEIGRALHISPRTVQSHVSSILAKLDLGSRSELAAEVARRG